MPGIALASIEHGTYRTVDCDPLKGVDPSSMSGSMSQWQHAAAIDTEGILVAFLGCLKGSSFEVI
jgi:hypothetical protein